MESVRLNRTDLDKMIDAKIKGIKGDVTAIDFVRAMETIIVDAAKDGMKITLNGFGAFKPFVRKARKGRNPKTGEEVDIPEKRTLVFHVSNKVIPR